MGVKETSSTLKEDVESKISPPLIDSILDVSRMQALKNCDRKIFTYDPHSFLLVFGFRGRNFQMITFPLLALLFWDIGLVCIMNSFPQVEQFLIVRNNEDGLGLGLEDLITPLLTPVSFLMVFRLGRAAVRYWDARAAMGKLIEISRSFISTAIVHVNYASIRRDGSSINLKTQPLNDPQKPGIERLEGHMLIEEISRWTCAFPISVKNFLRPEKSTFYRTEAIRDKQRRAEIGSLLNKNDIHDLLNCLKKGEDKSDAVIMVLNKLRQLSHQASRLSLGSEEGDLPQIGLSVYRQLNSQIDTLTGAWGAMERINSTPLPYVYVVHLRTFLLLYLFLWHVVAVVDSRWKALPPLFAGSWALLGIEAAAVECERPFKWHSNHLALGRMCAVVSTNVAQTLRNVTMKS